MGDKSRDLVVGDLKLRDAAKLGVGLGFCVKMNLLLLVVALTSSLRSSFYSYP